jgi:hypothetical protein
MRSRLEKADGKQTLRTPQGGQEPSPSVFSVVLLKEAVGTQLSAVSFDII